jgi:signal transduction histidine kinase
MRFERTDGAVLNCSIVPLPDGGVLITYIDNTATTLVERSLRERNEALEAGDRLKTEFLANMSYELRAPLTSISGFAEMLRDDYFGSLSDDFKLVIKKYYYKKYSWANLNTSVFKVFSAIGNLSYFFRDELEVIIFVPHKNSWKLEKPTY